jgi:hypothetical protein
MIANQNTWIAAASTSPLDHRPLGNTRNLVRGIYYIIGHDDERWSECLNIFPSADNTWYNIVS